MKSLVLLVEDDDDILAITKKSLELRGYDVLTAINGINALEVLSESETLPELIISDIMMPGMDGYDFFRAVSDDIRLNQIPFVFLTAYSTPEDIRFGKMLGVDDYITKPIKIKDLLAVVDGKISRGKKIRSLREKFEKLTKIDTKPSISEDLKDQVIILYVVWHDALGPDLDSYFPSSNKNPFNLQNIGAQLFQATVSIYGHEKISHAEGILINIDNINKAGYLYFDAYPDRTYRGGEKQYMIGVIAPQINYYESLQIKEVFENISLDIKNKKNWNIETCWENVTEILTKSAL